MPITKNRLIVYGTVTFIVALLLCAVLFAITKTGLIRVPLFSRWYTGPQPTRNITPTPLSSDQFLRAIQDRFQLAAQNTQPPYAVTVNESEVSGAVQSAVQDALRTGGWSRTDVQVVLRSSDMEVTGRFARGFLRPEFLMRFVPRIDHGGLVFDPIAAQIGDIPLPASWITPVLGFLFSRDFGTWTISFGSMHLQGVQLLDGAMKLTIAPTSP